MAFMMDAEEFPWSCKKIPCAVLFVNVFCCTVSPMNDEPPATLIAWRPFAPPVTLLLATVIVWLEASWASM
jgi:hypothetical protein